ncbi:tryptophanase leader peptide [Escherichia coli]|nr:tryptophanase leader peptide [Escherichia coli]
MNILHICVTSKWFNCRSPPLICPSVAITRAKPIRFNVIYWFAIS